MWQVVLFRTPGGSEIAEVLSIHETLLERPFRNRKQEKCNKTQTQSLCQSIYDDHVLPVIPAKIQNYCSPFQIVYAVLAADVCVKWWTGGLNF